MVAWPLLIAVAFVASTIAVGAAVMISRRLLKSSAGSTGVANRRFSIVG